MSSDMDTSSQQSGLATIARMEENLEWMSSGRRAWKPSHLTEWPSVVHDAFGRLVALPDVARAEVTRVTEVCSVTVLGVWELGQHLWRDGVSQVEGASREIWTGFEAAAETLTARRPRSATSDWLETDR